MNKSQTQTARRVLLDWYDRANLKLPWRGTKDPYRIFVSELMLQQTRAQTVVGYYERFLFRWPDVTSLARAQLTDVLKGWEGLGYYARARNLRAASQIVADELGGTFPPDAAGLLRLPGIGEYTAAMIASIAYGECAPAIDGNQIRALSRLFMMDRPARSKEGMAALRAHAMQLIDPARPGDFNQALMDLARNVCKPKRPDCGACPLRSFCMGHASGDPAALPILPKRATQRIERHGVAIVIARGKVWVKQRPEAGLLGGLYVFPHFIDADSRGAVAEILEENAIKTKEIGGKMEVEHIFTHLIWRQKAFAFRAKVCAPLRNGRWVDASQLRALPMTAAHFGFRDWALQLMEEDGE